MKALFFNLLFIFFLSAVTFAAEDAATVDHTGRDKEKPSKNAGVLDKSNSNYAFSLRSGMYFKGGNLINTESATSANAKYFNLNNINFEKGQNSYLLPYKKKAVLNKLTFNPNELLRNYSGR